MKTKITIAGLLVLALLTDSSVAAAVHHALAPLQVIATALSH